MIRRFPPRGIESGDQARVEGYHTLDTPLAVAGFALAILLAAGVLPAQVLTIDTSGKGGVAANGPVDRQFQQIVPTHVVLGNSILDPKSRLMLIRALQSEQGFAMRPFPRGHKGLTLAANGKLEPAGESYLNMVVNQGLSAKPGQRIVITDIKVQKSKIVFDFNGGPDAKHRFLRHIQIDVGPDYGDDDLDPALLDQSGDPAGARLTLTFGDHIPELTPSQVKALLAPLISFDVKTPIQAFTDTLPRSLKEAILDHKVWVGMSTDMVLFAKGRPESKSREMDGQMPFEVWIYGTPPEEVTFVRINGNRVIRVEIAKMGQPVEVFTKDVVSPLLMSGGSPELADSNVRIVKEGDVERDPNKEAPAPPPSLRNPGEQLPTDHQSTGVMRPVQMPKPHSGDDQLGANPDEQQSAQPEGSQTSKPGVAQPSPSTPRSQPANGAGSQPAPAQTPANGSQKPAPNPSQFAPSATIVPGC
jgi:hypothetical protein